MLFQKFRQADSFKHRKDAVGIGRFSIYVLSQQDNFSMRISNSDPRNRLATLQPGPKSVWLLQADQ